MHNVLVTGGSRGIGLSIARRLVAAGYHVIAVARRESEELQNAIEEAVRQWRFKPYLKQGSPAEVETGMIFGRKAANM